jgi:hypothetical protein
MGWIRVFTVIIDLLIIVANVYNIKHLDDGRERFFCKLLIALATLIIALEFALFWM